MAATRPLTRILGLFIVLLALSGSALALNTHLSITVSETVQQNVTYAENFDLVENRTYSLIEGVISVLNPSTETVFDTNIRLDNIENLASDFINNGGRAGFQVIFPQVGDNTTSLSGNITNGAWFSLGRDLDEDGVTDLVTHNDTHLIFNLTSEYDLHSVPFSNATNASLDISSAGTVLGMSFQLSSLRDDGEYNDGVVFANITVSGTVTTAGQLTMPSEVAISVGDTARPYAILHIPELRPSDQSVFNYNISSLLVAPPLDIDSEYTNPEFQTKVVAGEHFNVRLTASNVATVGDLTNVNVTLRAWDVNVTNMSNPSQWDVFNFTLHNLSTNPAISDDWANVVNNTNRTWYWGVNGGTLPIGESYNISFSIRAPDTVATSGTHLALQQILQYQINTTGSTLTVSQVRGRGAVVFNTTKRIVSPQDNLSNTYVTWESRPTIGTPENITYTLEKVTLWVTTTLNPNNAEPGLTREYSGLDYDINQTTLWFPAQSGMGAWLFNFTDGSGPSSPPPIVWVKPYWIIKNTGNQIINSSITVNGTDLYMNYIYVVNGYWLEVEKQVLDAGDDAFDIKITVQNRGNGYTPQNLTVTVYDFIPTEFTATNFSPSFDAASNVTGEFAGTAYQWDVGLRTDLSTSFSPKGSSDGLDVFYVNYSVNGSGDFRVSDLYIVGLDPRLVDGASAHEGVSVLSAIASTSREKVYALVVVFLIAINLANFMMTSRINRKLR